MSKRILFIVFGLLLSVTIVGGLIYKIIHKHREVSVSHQEPQDLDIDGQGKGVGNAKFSSMAEKLDEFERIINRFYRRDPITEAQAGVNRLVDDYNQWVKTSNTKYKEERARLEKEAESVRNLGTQIEELDKSLSQQKPDSSDKDVVQAYNANVSNRNALVKKHNELYQSYKKTEETFNESVNRFQQEMTVRGQQVESAKAEAEESLKAYQRWRESHQDVDFSEALNHFYAFLHQEKRRLGKNYQLDMYIDKVRAIRHELGAHAVKKQKDGENGLILVQATLCRSEECFLIVDTGASIVTITPSLVEVLGLSDRLGDEIQVTLAGGIRTKGPELLIPQLSVFGMEAQDVKAVVLNESEVGVDGCLGLSFLNQFSYRIDKEQQPKLILEPKTSNSTME